MVRFIFLSFLKNRIGYNGQRYAQYGISKPLPYQDAERLRRATDTELRCIPCITNNAYYRLAFIHYQ